MTDPEELERELASDLSRLGQRCADEAFCSDLYRALAGSALFKDDRSGHVAPSWQRAQDIVNRLRADSGRDPLELAQSGGEGEVSATVAGELRQLGWRARPRNTARHDDAHLASPRDAPPPDQGERRAPVDAESADWEERAHEEADADRRIMPGRPGMSGATIGRDPEERAHPSG
jgi:hypothetical protein